MRPLAIMRFVIDMRWVLLTASLSIIWCLPGCNSEGTSEAPPAAPASEAVSEHRFQEFHGRADKVAGAQCSTYGSAECASGLCLHVEAKRGTGYRCVERCGSNGECPAGAICVAAAPTDGISVCIPRGSSGGKQ